MRFTSMRQGKASLHAWLLGRATAMMIAVGLAAVSTEVQVAAASQTPVGQELALVKADTARFQFMVARDIPALDRSLADELVYVHTSSMRQSKSEHIDDIRTGKAVYARIEPREQVPSVYGETGIIQGVALFTTGAADNQSAFVLRYTSVYVWRKERWQLVAFACSRIPDHS